VLCELWVLYVLLPCYCDIIATAAASATVVCAAAVGVRNYVARNHLRAMQLGDRAFFYHSSCKTPGIVGIVEVGRGRGCVGGSRGGCLVHSRCTVGSL
jgi:hypothetical protein